MAIQKYILSKNTVSGAQTAELLGDWNTANSILKLDSNWYVPYANITWCLVTNSTVQANITNSSNWNANEVYTGSLTWLKQWDYYLNAEYQYVYNGTILYRIPNSVQLKAVKTASLKTVGTGWDYTTVWAAIAAWYSNLIFISNVTETNTLTTALNGTINLNGYLWLAQSYTVTRNGKMRIFCWTVNLGPSWVGWTYDSCTMQANGSVPWNAVYINCDINPASASLIANGTFNFFKCSLTGSQYFYLNGTWTANLYWCTLKTIQWGVWANATLNCHWTTITSIIGIRNNCNFESCVFSVAPIFDLVATNARLTDCTLPSIAASSLSYATLKGCTISDASANLAWNFIGCNLISASTITLWVAETKLDGCDVTTGSNSSVILNAKNIAVRNNKIKNATTNASVTLNATFGWQVVIGNQMQANLTDNSGVWTNILSLNNLLT